MKRDSGWGSRSKKEGLAFVAPPVSTQNGDPATRRPMNGLSSFTLETAAHLVQVALTPVFLLSGIAALLNVFAGRLARVADRLDEVSDTVSRGTETPLFQNEEIVRLHRRSLMLDAAVMLGTAGAAATCLSILTLFLFAVSRKAIAAVLLASFGVAILCTLGSVAFFGLEMLMSSSALRHRMRFHMPHLVLGGFRRRS